MRPRAMSRRCCVVALLVVAALALPDPTAAAEAQTALATVLAAYHRLHDEHLQPLGPEVLLTRALAAAFHQVRVGRRVPPPVVADVGEAGRPGDGFDLRGDEARDLQRFQQAFLLALAGAPHLPPLVVGHAAIRGMTQAYHDPYTRLLDEDGAAGPPVPGRPTVTVRVLDGGLAHLVVPTLAGAVPRQALQAITALQARGTRGLILDLRGNGGGPVLGAMLLAGPFLPSGPVARARYRSGRTVPYPVLPARRFEGGVAVLVDGGTASAAEILAAALQEAGIPLVGRRTYGKALVQSVWRLPDGAILQYTTARVLTAQGRDLGDHGLAPDVAVARGEDPLAAAAALLRARP